MSALLPNLISKLKKICAVENDVNAVGLSTGIPQAWPRYKSDSCRWSLLLAGVLHCFTVFAQTPVSGPIAVDKRWDIAGAPYIVSGDVVVQNGVTLSIDPDVSIYMTADSSLRVQEGAIQALGSAAKPIRVLSDSSRLGQSSAAGDWKQWVFGSGTVNTRLEHVEFAHGSGLVVNSSAPVFNYLNIHDHTGAAISVDLAASPSGVGNRASGNGINGVAVPAGDISGSVKWAIRGIPYVVASGTVSVGASPAVTSIAPDTLQPGETITATVVGKRLAGLASASFAHEGLAAQVLEGATDTLAQLSITAESSVLPGNAALQLLVDAGNVHIPGALKIIQSQPVLTALTPSTVYLGQGGVVLLLSGRGMTSQSLALINGENVPTVYLSPTELRASVTVPASVTNLSVRLQTPDPVNPGQFLNSNELVLPVVTAQLAVAPSTASVSKGAVKAFTVTLPYAAPVGGTSLNLVSSVPTVATVPASLAIPEGQRSATFQLDALDLGVTTLTISKLGFVSAQAQVTVTPPPTLTLAPSTITLGVGRTAGLTIQSSIPASGSGLSVALSSSDPFIATLPASVMIPAGGNVATVSLSTVATGEVTITAQAADFITGSANVTVRPKSLYMPSDELVAPEWKRLVGITLSDPAPDGGLEIQLISSAEGVASVPAKVTVQGGQSTISFSLIGIAAGTAYVTATADGYRQATMPVTVEAVKVSVGQPAVSEISVAEGTSQSYLIRLSSPAPEDGVVIGLATTDAAKAVVNPASILVNKGQISGAVLATVSGVAKGNTVLSVSADGLNATNISVSVMDKPNLAFSKEMVAVGKGLKTHFNQVHIYRKAGSSNYSPNQALTVSLSSGDPSKVSVPATVTIPAGMSYATVFLIGVDLTNTVPVLIDATAEGYGAPAAKLAVDVVAPVFKFSSLSEWRSPDSERDGFQVYADVPGLDYRQFQTAVDDLPISLDIVEASPVDIVDGFYSETSGGNLISQVLLRKDASFSDMAFVGVPTATGGYRVRASSPGIGEGTSTKVDVSTDKLSFSVESVNVGKGMETDWEPRVIRMVNGQPFNGKDDLVVTLTSSDPSKVSVPKTVTIFAGLSYARVAATGVDLTDGSPVTIDATAEGYSPPKTKLSANVVKAVLDIYGLSNTKTAGTSRNGFNVQVSVPGEEYQVPIADQPISIEIVEASPAGVVDGFYSESNGGALISEVLLRKGDPSSDVVYVGVPSGAGSYKVRASANSMVSATSNAVAVYSPEVGPCWSNMQVAKGMMTRGCISRATNEPTLSRMSEQQTFSFYDEVTVSLSSSDPSKVGVPATVTIPAGENDVGFYITGMDLTNDQPVTISVTAPPGYRVPEENATVSVVAPVLTFLNLDNLRSTGSERDGFQVYATVPDGGEQVPITDLPISLGIVEASSIGIVDGFFSEEIGGGLVNQVLLREGEIYSDPVYVGVPTVAGSYKVRANAAGFETGTSDPITITP